MRAIIAQELAALNPRRLGVNLHKYAAQLYPSDRHFFITGLPRSRTAWMAAFMSTGQAHCFHDVLADCEPSGMRAKMNFGARWVGDSDSALTLFHKEVKQEFPKAPWLVIDRSVHDVYASLSRIESVPCFAELMVYMATLLAETKRAVNPMVVRFDQLDDEGTMREIVAHLCPGMEFNKERFELFKLMNIQITGTRWEHLFEAFKKAA